MLDIVLVFRYNSATCILIGLGLRGIAQLVERRSPKPKVVGSMPTAPAIAKRDSLPVFC